MKLLIDECLHESLVGVAHTAGFEVTHVNYLGLSGRPDWELAGRIVQDEFTFVTNNRVDFLRLFGKMDLHPGLIVLVPNVVPALQRALLAGALRYLSASDLVNTVMEVTLKGTTVQCVTYSLPAS